MNVTSEELFAKRCASEVTSKARTSSSSRDSLMEPIEGLQRLRRVRLESGGGSGLVQGSLCKALHSDPKTTLAFKYADLRLVNLNRQSDPS